MSTNKTSKKAPAKVTPVKLLKSSKPVSTNEGSSTGSNFTGESPLTMRNLAFQEAGSDRVEMTVQSIIETQTATDFTPIEVPRANAIQDLVERLASRLSNNDVMIIDLANNLGDVLATYAPVNASITQLVPDNASPLYVSIVNVLEQAVRQSDLLAAITANLEV